MPDLPSWQVQSLTVDLAAGMFRSLCSLVEYAPGNGKKVTLDWYVDCEIYKKHQYIKWGVRKAWSCSAPAGVTSKATNERRVQWLQRTLDLQELLW